MVIRQVRITEKGDDPAAWRRFPRRHWSYEKGQIAHNLFCKWGSKMLDRGASNVVLLGDVVKELRLYRKGNQDE